MSAARPYEPAHSRPAVAERLRAVMKTAGIQTRVALAEARLFNEGY